LLLFCASAGAQTVTPKDFELACAVASSIQMAEAPKGSTTWQNAYALTGFYLGRLSGRDDKTYLGTVVKGRIAEMHGQPVSQPLLVKCAELFAQKFK
jgi:hypothetical protein